MLKCAIYVRVSTEEQAIHGLSLETQCSELKDYAKSNDYEIIDYYVDGGKTARKSLSSRIELQRLLEDVKNNKIDIIIFSKLDRWFRNVRDYHKVQEILEKHNVHWKTIKENYDTTTANGRLHINIMLSVAQDEADRTGERIKAVLQNKLKNGEAISGSLPIGYKISHKKVVIDNDKISIARDVFNMYYLYQSQNRVFKEIFEKYNLSLCDKTIRRMLSNSIYIGTYRGYPNFCEPIIEENIFYEIQDILQRRNIKYIPTNRTFIFTGLLVCSECTHKLAANAQIRNYSKGKKEYILYRCNQYYSRKLCSHKKVIYETTIENYLLANIKKEIVDYISAINSTQPKQTTPKVNKVLIRKKLEKLKNLYLNDLIDLEMYKVDYDKYTTILNTPDIHPPSCNIQPLIDFSNFDYESSYTELSPEEKRILWRNIIRALIITPDNKIKVMFIN